MTKIKTHLVFPTALHIFNHSMDTSEKQTMLDYIKGTRNYSCKWSIKTHKKQSS